MPRQLTIVPQRFKRGTGWVTCAEHAAQRWALFKGKTCLFHNTSKAIVRGQLKVANAVATDQFRSRQRQPGSPYGPLGVRGHGHIIAASLRAPTRK